MTALNVYLFLLFCLFAFAVFQFFYLPLPHKAHNRNSLDAEEADSADPENTRLILITPTKRRAGRLADMTRFSQTLMHIPNLHWILVEDGPKRSDAIERLLRRTGIKYTYLVKSTASAPGYPGKGHPQRNLAMDFVRTYYRYYASNAVVYFADDDNSYDLRLFREYLPKVRTIGFWAVGLAQNSCIEAPIVRNHTIVGWMMSYATWRTFGIDMAGFAMNLEMLRRFPHVQFHRQCGTQPEDCLLRQFGIPPSELQAFGYDKQPKEVLVWHTKTANPGDVGDPQGYIVTD